MLDSSVVKLRVKPGDLSVAVANTRSGKESNIFFETIHEDRGFDALKQDDYVKYDPEPNEEMIKAMAGTTINSRIELIDNSGFNRIIVRRNSSRV